MTERRLTPDEVQHYHEHGYVVLGKLLDDHWLDALRREEARFNPDPPAGQTIFRSQLCDVSEPVRRFATQGPHIPLLADVIGPNVIAWFNQFVTKPPDADSGRSEFPWHQDNGYVAVEPATNVTIWFALDDVDQRNGCVWVMPGSHRRGLLDHRQKSADSWHLSLPVEGDGVPAVLKAGEAVMFSGLTLHRSKLNHTDRPRRAMFVEYADALATYRRGNDAPQPIRSMPESWMVLGEVPWSPPGE